MGKRAVWLRAEQPELSLASDDARREVVFSAAGAHHLTGYRCCRHVLKLLEDSKFPKLIMLLFVVELESKVAQVHAYSYILCDATNLHVSCPECEGSKQDAAHGAMNF